MSPQALSESPAAPALGSKPALDRALEELELHAAELDERPRFPRESFAALREAGVPQLAADRERCGLRTEVGLVRALASVDASVARIVDGHFNGVERLALLGEEEFVARELAQIADGSLLLGVWGADPGPGEGCPASIELATSGELVLNGVKTFCSGAGGVQRALVVARDERGARRVAYVDVTRGGAIDRAWYRASGLRASESHRVEFEGAPVSAVLGVADELAREPWFSRDAVRTAATWAGIADGILAATTRVMVERGDGDELRLHALGRMRLARATIDRWLEHASAELDDAPGCGEERALAAECRLALAEQARLIAAEAARVCGSRALIGASTVDRARRDLDLFLLQHRLEPKLVQLGADLLSRGGS
ncbi:MAG TPA: acyl-CoA dehydrogenase family protein [Solirubrobacteraceae bacterium]|jgi:alkylation response protein AidB-like acyl-CoA dehydrogenase|nr:acyl-CoA dehydrogenase family protein [Solirubrobacteraceae bacterium]